LVTYRMGEFDPLIGLGRVAEADSKVAVSRLLSRR
jgi:hypothetical protein